MSKRKPSTDLTTEAAPAKESKLQHTATAASSSSPAITLEFAKKLPKIELHAHLSGSVRESTVLKLLHEEHVRKTHVKGAHTHSEAEEAKLLKDIDSKIESEMQTFKLGDRNLEECFEVFSILHRLLDNAEAISRVTKGERSLLLMLANCYALQK